MLHAQQRQHSCPSNVSSELTHYACCFAPCSLFFPSFQLIARAGRWLRTALNTSYLQFYKPESLLAAGGWDKDRPDGFFAERFCLDVEDELISCVFPWMDDLRNEVRGVLSAVGDRHDVLPVRNNALQLSTHQGCVV